MVFATMVLEMTNGNIDVYNKWYIIMQSNVPQWL